MNCGVKWVADFTIHPYVKHAVLNSIFQQDSTHHASCFKMQVVNHYLRRHFKTFKVHRLLLCSFLYW